jgi:hypothetical protein
MARRRLEKRPILEARGGDDRTLTLAPYRRWWAMRLDVSHVSRHHGSFCSARCVRDDRRTLFTRRVFDPREMVDYSASTRDIAGLVRLLWHSDPGVRSAAARELEELGGPASREDLIEALEAEDRDVRLAAPAALGAIGGTAAVDALTGKLLSKSHHVERWHAAAALGRLGDAGAVPALRIALEDRRIRSAVVGALGDVGTEDARHALRDLKLPWWRYLARRQVRDAVMGIENPGRRLATRPLIRTVTLAPIRLTGLLLAAALIIAFALAVLGADARNATLVALATVVVLTPWHLLRKSLGNRWGAVIAKAAPMREELVVESVTQAGPRVLLRIALLVPIDMCATAIGSLIVDPAVVAGLVAGLPAFASILGGAIWVRRWESRTGCRLLRESTEPWDRDPRFFIG